MCEKTYIARWIGLSKSVDRAELLVVPFLVVQTAFKASIISVLRLNGENNAWAFGMHELVCVVEHLPKHGRCRAAPFTDTVVTLCLEAVDFSQYRACYDQPNLFEPIPWRLVVQGLGCGGNRPSASGHRGSTGARRGQPDRGGLYTVGPDCVAAESSGRIIRCVCAVSLT